MLKNQFCLAAVLLLMSLSCSTPNGNDVPLSSPSLTTPIVTGLYVTNSESPQMLAVWETPQQGNPSESYSNSIHTISGIASDLPRQNSFQLPYPNPSSTVCNITFAVPRQSIVDVWTVHAQWAGNMGSGMDDAAGAVVPTTQKTPAVIFYQNKSLLAGFYTVQWDWSRSDGNSVDPGFYRIYCRIDNITYSHDVLLYKHVSDLPSDLRKLIPQ